MAITEKYVSSVAAGGGTGLTAGSPLTWSEMVTAINAGTEAGSRFNVKSDGTYNRSASDTVTGVGTSTSPVVIRGYKTSIGDGFQGRTNGNGPLVTTNMPAVAYGSGFSFALPASSWIVVESLVLTAAVNGTAFGATLWSLGTFVRCSLTNSGTSTPNVILGRSVTVFDCDVTGVVGATTGINFANGVGCAARNRVTACLAGIALQAGCSVVGNVVYRCATGLSVGAAGQDTIAGNTIVKCTGSGIVVATAAGTTTIINNLITDNGGYGIDAGTNARSILAAYNRLDRNTLGATNLGTDWLAASSWGHNTDSATQAQEYVDVAGNDYRLLPTSPAKGAGWFSYADVGALQRQEGGGILLPYDFGGGIG